MHYFVFGIIVGSIGIGSILFSNKKKYISQDNPATEEIVENKYGNYCKDCGATVVSGNNYCTNCGNKL